MGFWDQVSGAIAAIADSMGKSSDDPAKAKKSCVCGAVIIYGRGADLGDFSVYANHLANDLKPTYENRIVIKNIQNKNEFIKYLHDTNFGFDIAEIHVFAHSAGGGIYLDYHGSASGNSRSQAIGHAQRAGRQVTYEEVVEAEIGALLTDDLIKSTFLALKAGIIKKFCRCGPTGTPFIKLWGCNAGVSNWVYDAGYWAHLTRKMCPSHRLPMQWPSILR